MWWHYQMHFLGKKILSLLLLLISKRTTITGMNKMSSKVHNGCRCCVYNQIIIFNHIYDYIYIYIFVDSNFTEVCSWGYCWLLFNAIWCFWFLMSYLVVAWWRHMVAQNWVDIGTVIMACCLTAPRHYLNQCWLIISRVQWPFIGGQFIRYTSATSH